MDLELVELTAPAGVRWWVPFDSSEGFEPRWWCTQKYTSVGHRFVRVIQRGQEVARVELDDSLRLAELDHYAEVPVSGKTPLEIQFIEVARSQRRDRIGTAVIGVLAAAYPDRQLAAFSEGADEFWASLGWDRYLAKETPHLLRPLFVQPVSAVPVGALPLSAPTKSRQATADGARSESSDAAVDEQT